MENKMRILGIAPYEGMRGLMDSLAKEFPQIDLTIFVGDLEQGVEIAKSNFYFNFDVVISRGGTARMLRNYLKIPVIEIATSMYDVLCALKLANGMSGKIAMVSYSNIAAETRLLCSLMNYDIDIHTIESPDEAVSVLREIQKKDYQAILCDVIADATAKRLGLNSFLITSGADSIRQAYRQALLLWECNAGLRDKNLFYRALLAGQIEHMVVLQESGEVYFSTLETPAPDVLTLLRQELPDALKETERRITRYMRGMLYTIHTRQILSGETACVAFYIVSSKSPISLSRAGIYYYTHKEVEDHLCMDVSGFAGRFAGMHEELDRLCQSGAPVLVAGEPGTEKGLAIGTLYARGPLRHNSFVRINCGMLNDKSWDFLLEHYKSPLAGEKSTIYFGDVDALPEERLQKLLTILLEMDVCQRNQVLFSCVCPMGNTLSDSGALVLNRLRCRLLCLEPLRNLSEQIPTLINLSLSRLNIDRALPLMGAEPSAITLLQTYRWPHNYVQFGRVMENLSAVSEGPLI